MTRPSIDRRSFNSASLMSLLAGAAATCVNEAAAQPRPPASGAARRQVLKQELPGEPARELLLLEISYAPGAGSPAHLHANGVAAFVVSGAVASQVNDGPEQVFRAGEAWWEPQARCIASHAMPARPSRQACLRSSSHPKEHRPPT